MSAEPSVLRAEMHPRLGTLLQQLSTQILERWAVRIVEENPTARRLHRDALLDDLPLFLWELGHALASHDATHGARPARVHGRERFAVGWSLPEVVRDYQILRLVLVESLEDELGRSLRSREGLAVHLAIDDAIAESVSAYVELQHSAPRPETRPVDGGVATEDFLAILGHELRNPLAPLRNALHVLPQVARDPQRLEWARGIMERQVKHLSRLVDDLQDVSRVARGRLVIQPEPLDLVAFTREVVEDRRESFAGAGVELIVETPVEPVTVAADAMRLTQVLGNLLANAQKFTDAGGTVTVAVTLANGEGCVTITDTGVGIEPDVLPRVFEAYAQADRSLERSRGGLGLGLALVKGFVELHGGRVEAASPGPGQGARFRVWLPGGK